MAKVKSSKFSKILKDIRSSNEQTDIGISDLRRDVNDLENTVLLIMEKIRRIEKYPVVQTKKGKLIPTKLDVDTTAIPANDQTVGGDINNETSKNILIKMYNFMVRNSEKQKNKDDKERKQKRTLEKKKDIDYRKEMLKAGLDPKFFRKRGLLEKVGTGLKWTTFAAIGLGISGLVYLFIDEIKVMGKGLKESLGSLGEFLSQKFGIFKTFYEDLKAFIGKYVLDNPVVKWMKGQIDAVFASEGPLGFISTKLDNLITEVVKAFSEMKDWVSSLIEPIIKIMQNPKEFLKDSFKDITKGLVIALKGGISGTIGRMFGGASAISSKIIEARSESQKNLYGEEYYKETEKFLDSIPAKVAKDIIKRFLFKGDWQDKINASHFMDSSDTLSGEQKRIAVDMMIQYPALKENLSSAGFIDSGRDLSMKEKFLPLGLPGQESPTETYAKEFKQKTGMDAYGFRDERQKQEKTIQELGKKRIENFFVKNLEGYSVVNAEESLRSSSGISIKNPEGDIINSVNDPEKFYELLIKAKIFDSAKDIKSRVMDSDAVKKLEEMQKEVVDLKKKAEEWSESTAIPSVQSAARTVGDTATAVVSSVRQEFGEVSTPEEAMVATGNLASKATNAVTESVIKPLAEKTSKFTADDLFSVANKSYDVMQKGIGEVIGVANKFSNWDEASKFIGGFTGQQKVEENLTPEQRRTEVSQDPNEDPFHLQTMFDQSKERIAPVNKIVNNKGSTSSTDNFAFPPVRNSDPSKKWCVIDSLCKP